MTGSVLAPAADIDQGDVRQVGRPRLWQMAVLLHDAVRCGTGGTLDPRSCQFASLDRGYLVSLKRFGRRFPGDPSVFDIVQWLDEIPLCLAGAAGPLYIGIWRHPDTTDVWCDVNLLLDTYASAMRRGLIEMQHSVFDNARSRSCPVTSLLDGTARSEP